MIIFLLMVFLVVFAVNAESIKQDIPSAQEVKNLAETLPLYSAERDCGFEALSVFEPFGGYIVAAQNPIPDGIYSVKKLRPPKTLPKQRDLVGMAFVQ